LRACVREEDADHSRVDELALREVDEHVAEDRLEHVTEIPSRRKVVLSAEAHRRRNGWSISMPSRIARLPKSGGQTLMIAAFPCE
jgi:hypothetical protein